MIQGPLDLESCAPIPSPKGVMDISAPSWKKPMPKISMSAPTKNIITILTSKSTNKLTISTIAVIGSTAESDSDTFSLSLGFIYVPAFIYKSTHDMRNSLHIILIHFLSYVKVKRGYIVYFFQLFILS